MPPRSPRSPPRGIAVDDACHALGSRIQLADGNWRELGGCPHADMAVFSFHPVKTIAMVKGGAVTTDESSPNERLRNHGLNRDHGTFLSRDLAFSGTERAMIPIAVPNLGGNEAAYLRECVDTTFVSTVGPFVGRFEEMVAEAAGTAGSRASPADEANRAVRPPQPAGLRFSRAIWTLVWRPSKFSRTTTRSASPCVSNSA